MPLPVPGEGLANTFSRTEVTTSARADGASTTGVQVMLVTLTRVVLTNVEAGATWVVSSSGHGACTWSRPAVTCTRCAPLGMVICTFITLAAAVAPTGIPNASSAATMIAVSWFEENDPRPRCCGGEWEEWGERGECG